MNEPAADRRGVLAWFASNHVAANLLMWIVVVAGVLSLWRIKVEVFQEIDPQLIRVTVPYAGATPCEVEEGICLRVEEAIKGIEGIERIRSVANEGLGTVIAELEDYADDREVLDDIKSAMDRIEDFPPRDAEEPVVVDVDARIQVISLVIYGDTAERTLKKLAERARDELTTRSDISLVDIVGTRRYEISIEVSEQTLRRHGLTFSQVADMVRRSSLDLPGGSIKTRGGEILLRTKGQRYVGGDFENIVVLTRTDGTKLHLKNVATIVDGFEDFDTATYFDGKPAVLLKVYRVGDQGALEVADTVKEYVDTRPLPDGIRMATWFDRSAYLRGRLHLLVRNAAIGLVLVFLCLTLFLDLRLAFWTTAGIFISFMGAFMAMPLFGVSLNMISLFALIIVLGLVVDDAIVVGENIFDYRQKGLSDLTAAIRGVKDMAMPVVLAVLTTVAAFLPLMYTSGHLGKILWPIAVVVSCVLAMSLVEALLILPAHLSKVKRQAAVGPVARIQRHIRSGLQWFIDRPYTRTLGLAVRWRYVTVAIALAILLTTIGYIRGGHIKFRFMPDIDADNVWVALSMPQGTPRDQTETVVQRLEAGLALVREEFDAQTPDDVASIITHVSTSIGEQPFTTLAGHGPGALQGVGVGSAHLAEINVELLSGESRTIASTAIAHRWRQLVGDIPGVASLTYHSRFFDVGKPINIEIAHQDFDTLLAAAEQLKGELAAFAGVTDIADSFEPGKQELRLSLSPAGRAAGLTLEDLARQVRQGFYGEEIQRVQRGRDDIKVMVRYPKSHRRSLADLDEVRVRLPGGAAVPFATVATVQPGRGYAAINRIDRRRVVSVTADVNDTVGNATEINNSLHTQVLPALQAQHPGLNFGFEGERREQQEGLQSLGNNFLIALLVIFALLAVQFRSYIQPLIVMSAIPFGLVGAVMGHLIMGLSLSMLSGFGIVALTGVVVNDSLIMIDLINRQRREGMDVVPAVFKSGTRRFRPIFLTTLTTFFGLMPMILEQSLQAKFLIPMAVSLGFGVVFATAITLLLVPSIYIILEDIRNLAVAQRPKNVTDEAAEASDRL